MSLLDKIKGEFIDIIEWNEDSADTVVWRFPRYQDEIKNGAKLTVRPSQVAVFVNEGKVADVFEPGMHTLDTRNLPILSTLKGWKFGFDSPFKAEVYFISTKIFTDLKWGTKNPVLARDAELGMIRLRAFGSYTLQVTDSKKLVAELAGTNALFTINDIQDQLRNIITTRFSDLAASSKIPILDLSAHLDEMSKILATTVADDFTKLGFRTQQLLIENISLPEEVERAIDKRTSINALGNLDQFTQYQAGTALEMAAQNPGGAAAGGVGLGVGLGLAGPMAGIAASSMAPPKPAQPSAATPPPLPSSGWWIALQGQQNGPHDLQSLARFVSAGTLNKDSLVWKEGMPHWVPCNTIAELKSLFP